MGAPARQGNSFEASPDAPSEVQLPEQLFGIDTQAALHLGRTVIELGVFKPETNQTIERFVNVGPLLDSIQGGISGAAETNVDMIDKARGVIDAIEDDVTHVAEFEPREQFVKEVNDFAKEIVDSSYEQRDWRVANKVVEPEIEPERGIKGFVTKVIRKVKRFFGWFVGKPRINPEVTAYDVGIGISKCVDGLLKNSDKLKEQFPLLAKFVAPKLPDILAIGRDKLSFLAPDILEALFSLSSDKPDYKELLATVRRNPHDLRFLMRFNWFRERMNKKVNFDKRKNAALKVLPAIQNVLPDKGETVQNLLTQVKFMLTLTQTKKTPKSTEPNIELPATKVKVLQKNSRVRKIKNFVKKHTQH